MEDYKKKYKESINKLKNFYKKLKNPEIANPDLVEDLENAFPELKESEDERIKEQIIWDRIKQMYNDMDDAAKSQVERAFPEPAESEDERISKEIIEFLEGFHYKPAKIGRWLVWLEKQGEKSAEWSKEGKEMFKSIITRLHSHPDVGKPEYDKSYHWLKSLRPQSQWKPTKEQINVLNAISNKDTLSEYERGMLCGLYTELKKLKEE